MLEGYLVQTCEILTPSRNEFGDYILNTEATEPCRFRYIDTIRRGTNEELNDSDSMIWLKLDTVAAKGKIIKFDNEYYQIERIWKARRLGSTAIQFTKADLKTIVVGVS